MTAAQEAAPVLATPRIAPLHRIRRNGRCRFRDCLGLLVVLLATGWTGTLRDLAERGAGQNYSFAVFLYVLMLVLTASDRDSARVLRFRLEHRYNLSNQRSARGFGTNSRPAVGLVMAAIVVELLTCSGASSASTGGDRVGGLPRLVCCSHNWPGCAVSDLLQIRAARKRGAQAPLDHSERTHRARCAGSISGISPRKQEANAALTDWARPGASFSPTPCWTIIPDEIEAVLAHELGHHVHGTF